MKRLFTALALLLTFTLSTSAMSYEQARNQALFLTDKMAYELNLTDQQYEAAYEINLDYLMRIDNTSDLYGAYWRQRNLDLSYILLDWQYRAYVDASYFYRPLYWNDGFWHFGIYARYPHRDFFYFGCPNFVWTYTGGHSWFHNGGRSWYHGRMWDGPRDGGPHPGMRHNWDNGRYGAGYVYQPGQRSWAQAPQRGFNPNGNRPNGNRSFDNRSNSNRSFGNRSFGTNPNGNRSFDNRANGNGANGNRSFDNRANGNGANGNRSFGNMREQGNSDNSPLRNGNSNRSFGTPRESSTRSTVNRSTERSSSNSSFGNRSFGSRGETPRGTFQPQQSSPSRSFSAPSRSSSSSSFGGGRSTGSFGNRGNSGGGSFGGGGGFGRR